MLVTGSLQVEWQSKRLTNMFNPKVTESLNELLYADPSTTGSLQPGNACAPLCRNLGTLR
eukprot:3768679-Amphidinium_carterae.1